MRVLCAGGNGAVASKMPGDIGTGTGRSPPLGTRPCLYNSGSRTLIALIWHSFLACVPTDRKLRLDLHYYTTIYLIVTHSAEYTVDIFQPLHRVVHPHPAVAGELQAFGQVQPGADD